MMFGTLVSYILDRFALRDATFIAIWVSVISTITTVFVASMHLFAVSMFNIALIYNMLICAATFGLWATLQFSFFQRQSPRIVLIFERLLFAVLPAFVPGAPSPPQRSSLLRRAPADRPLTPGPLRSS
jgi:hypothetical protein